MAISRSKLRQALIGLGYRKAQKAIFKELGAKSLTEQNITRTIKKLLREGEISRSAGAAFQKRFERAIEKAQPKPEILERKTSLLETLFGLGKKPEVPSNKKEVSPQEKKGYKENFWTI